MISEKQYVAEAMKDAQGDLNVSEEEEARKQRRQREKNIKLLRKQVLALAHEELAEKAKNQYALEKQSTITGGLTTQTGTATVLGR